jgi:hypothetical protein
MGPIGCPEVPVRNYHYSLGNNPEECSYHLLRGGSLRSRRAVLVRRAAMRPTGLDAFLCPKSEAETAYLKTRQWTNSDGEEVVTELHCRRQSPREMSSCFVLCALISSVCNVLAIATGASSGSP